MGVRPIKAKIAVQQLELRVDKSDQYQATVVDRTSTRIISIDFGAISHFPISGIRVDLSLCHLIIIYFRDRGYFRSLDT